MYVYYVKLNFYTLLNENDGRIHAMEAIWLSLTTTYGFIYDIYCVQRVRSTIINKTCVLTINKNYFLRA